MNLCFPLCQLAPSFLLLLLLLLPPKITSSSSDCSDDPRSSQLFLKKHNCSLSLWRYVAKCPGWSRVCSLLPAFMDVFCPRTCNTCSKCACEVNNQHQHQHQHFDRYKHKHQHCFHNEYQDKELPLLNQYESKNQCWWIWSESNCFDNILLYALQSRALISTLQCKSSKFHKQLKRRWDWGSHL